MPVRAIMIVQSCCAIRKVLLDACSQASQLEACLAITLTILWARLCDFMLNDEQCSCDVFIVASDVSNVCVANLLKEMRFCAILC